MQLERVFEVDVRGSFSDAEKKTNEELIILQEKGCKIISRPRYLERSSGFIIVSISYENQKAKVELTEKRGDEANKEKIEEEIKEGE